MTGCTVSVILFAAAMNLIVKSVERVNRGPQLRSGVRQPPMRIFIDDMTITTKTAIEGRWTLENLEEGLKWARMKVKPEKSRSLVLKKGKLTPFKFKIQGEVIPTIIEKPVKYLGKWYDESLKDVNNSAKVMKQAQEWLHKIQKSMLPGKFKTWIYQYGMLPRLLWPLLIYEIPISTVENLESKITYFLRRWLGVPRSLTSVGLYGRATKLRLPLHSVTEEYQITKVRHAMTLRSSKDPKISGANIQLATGRKWSTNDAIEKAESRLRHKELVGATTVGRQGLGFQEHRRWSQSSVREQRGMVQDEVRGMVEEERCVRAAAQSQQGRWTTWENAMERKFTWKDLWSMDSARLKFILGSVYDVLPSPANLVQWGVKEDASCLLCGSRGSLQHILSSCTVALAMGRYTWRHNQVLRVLADAIEHARKSSRTAPQRKTLPFVRAGEKIEKKESSGGGWLAEAGDWKMVADIGGKAVFPKEITETSLRPDMVVWTLRRRRLIIIELTVPWEDHLQEANERKREKYQDLAMECEEKGWKVELWPVEVGCRGFVGRSTWSLMRMLGIVGEKRRKTCEKAGEEAERASLWIWRMRSVL